jgi:hypothetical protein
VGGVKYALQHMATADVDIVITELDIKTAQPADYATVVNACLSVPRCIGITVSTSSVTTLHSLKPCKFSRGVFRIRTREFFG